MTTTVASAAAAAANLAPFALLIGDPLTMLLGALVRRGFRIRGGAVAVASAAVTA